MKLDLILAPYDSGHRHEGFGKGPQALLDAGLEATLRLAGHDVACHDIGEVGPSPGREIATGFAVCQAVAARVRETCAGRRFPIVLTGNCMTALGAVAGESADSIVWFDQHGDCNTPETSEHGFLDGMALAIVLGLCWRPMAGRIGGFRPIAAANAMLVDARDLDAGEAALLSTLPVIRASCGEAAEKVLALRDRGARGIHLHLDLDIHDPAELRVNRYAAPGGPQPAELRNALACMARSVPAIGLTISAYDPAYDPNAEVPPAVGALLVDFLAALERI